MKEYRGGHYCCDGQWRAQCPGNEQQLSRMSSGCISCLSMALSCCTPCGLVKKIFTRSMSLRCSSTCRAPRQGVQSVLGRYSGNQPRAVSAEECEAARCWRTKALLAVYRECGQLLLGFEPMGRLSRVWQDIPKQVHAVTVDLTPLDGEIELNCAYDLKKRKSGRRRALCHFHFVCARSSWSAPPRPGERKTG